MSNELHLDGDTGDTYDAYIFDSAGQVAVTAGTSFENWVAADTYDIAMVEVGVSGHFVGTFPATISLGVYYVGARKRAGINPANTDEKIGPATAFDWDGTAEINNSVIDAIVDAIKTKTDFLPSATAGEATGIMLTNHITADTGVVEASVEQILGTALVEGSGEAGQIADSFETFFNVNGATATTVDVSSILADTNELQTDWAEGGRLDLIIDNIAYKVNWLPNETTAAQSDVTGLNDFDPDNEDVNLASTGLDNISAAEVSGVATTFPQKVVQLWQRFFHKSTSTSDTLKTYKADGTVNTTQTAESDGTTKTVGKAT